MNTDHNTGRQIAETKVVVNIARQYRQWNPDTQVGNKREGNGGEDSSIDRFQIDWFV